MALKVLMTKKKIDSKRSELDALRAETNFETREADLERAIDEANTDEERDAVEEEINKLEAEKEEKLEKVKSVYNNKEIRKDSLLAKANMVKDFNEKNNK